MRADTLCILNGKRLKEENERSFFYEQDKKIIKKKDYMDNEQMLKEILNQTSFLTGKLDSIKNDNHEMCNKMNGVGVFLSQIVDLKKSSGKKKRSRWMDDCD